MGLRSANAAWRANDRRCQAAVFDVKALDVNRECICKVFVDLDNSLLPFDTVVPAWKQIIKKKVRPNVTKISIKYGVKNIAKSIMVSCFTEFQEEEYRAFFYELAEKVIKHIDLDVKMWSESLVQDKLNIHIVTGSLLPLAEGIAGYLGWGKSVGTEAETERGLLTGRIKGISIKGLEKVEAIKRVFNLKEEDFKFCAAAGDSYNDRYLMEKCSLRCFPKKSSMRLIRYFSSR